MAMTETVAAAETIEVRPLTIHIGAEIHGVDLRQPLAPETVREIREAFLKWKVVFFPGQNLDHRQHLDFARQFGELTVGHAVFGHVEGYPELYSVAKHRKKARYREGPGMVKPWPGFRRCPTGSASLTKLRLAYNLSR